MFGKLKERLMQAVSVFSKKTEEEAVVEEKVIQKPAKKTEKKEPRTEKVAEKKEPKERKEKSSEKKEKPAKIAKKASQKKDREEIAKSEEPETEVIEDQKEELAESQKIEEKQEEVAEQKPSFFKKLFGKKEEEVKKEIKEETAEEVREEITKEQEVEEKTEEKSSFFGKIKTSLTTKKISAEKFEELFWELELTLLENNVSIEVIEKIKEDLKEELVNKPLPRDVPAKIEETLKKTLTEILTFEKVDLLKKKEGRPLVIAFFGINGTGKTTSIAKLAHYFQKHQLSVILAACDTFRAAAIQQLEEHADKLGVKMVKHDYGSDAAAVAFDAVRYAEKNKIDVVLIDTAGRLHSNTNLMQELKKIIKIAEPDFKIFVGESITGNDCIEQARKFNDLVDIDGAILTKVDVDEKGGAPLSISYSIKKPILFLGVGQKYDDLEEFDAQVILKRLGF